MTSTFYVVYNTTANVLTIQETKPSVTDTDKVVLMESIAEYSISASISQRAQCKMFCIGYILGANLGKTGIIPLNDLKEFS